MIKVVGFLGHDDFIHVVGPSLEVLTDFVPSGAPMANTLAQLLEMPRPEVRVFALRGLGNYRTLSAAKLLMPFLASPHAQVRAVAAEGLGANPEARPGLIKLLLEGRDLEEVGRPVEALAALAPELTRLQVKKLVARFIKLVEADDPVRELFQRVLRRTKAEFVMPLLLENAKRLRQKRAYGEALRVLQVLATGADAEMNGDVRYEIAVTTLLKRGHVPETSEGDSVVGHFCHLIDENYELLARIKKERVLEVSDVLYLGQRFVERHDADRGFGTELLNWLIKKEPEAKESVQAMQKLKVEGLA
jgi:HEAT repeat protein